MFKKFAFLMIALAFATQAHATSNVEGGIEAGKLYPAIISVGGEVLPFTPPGSDGPQLVIKSMDIPGFSECVFFLNPIAFFPSERVMSSSTSFSCKKIDPATGLSSTTSGAASGAHIVAEDGLSGIRARLVVRQGGLIGMKDAIPFLAVDAGQKVYLYFEGEQALSGWFSMPAPPEMPVTQLNLKSKNSKVSK
jgi:hypothetical protein